MSMEWFGEALVRRIIGEGGKEAAKQGEYILTEAKRQVPVETGALMRTGTVKATSALNHAHVEISFNTPYALIQHENTGLHHTRPGAKAKYLEDPLRERADAALKAIAEAVKQ